MLYDVIILAFRSCLCPLGISLNIQTFKQVFCLCNKEIDSMISYMSAHALLNVLHELKKRDKMRGVRGFHRLFATILINSTIQKHEYYMTIYTIKCNITIHH